MSLQAQLFGGKEGMRARVVGVMRRPLAALQHAGRLDLRRFDARGGRILSLPPLRERTDFAALVRQLVREAEPGRPIEVRPEALALLRRHRWPGNVRELRNHLRLILALMREEAAQLCAEDIPAELLDEIAESQG
jgi:transcriptional regulator of acetoin/glycerol metabolism